MRSVVSWLGLSLFPILASGCLTGRTATDAAGSGQFTPAASDVARVKGQPPFGKWMISPNLTYADWMGVFYKGKRIREPINVVVVDPAAKSGEDALARFLAACERAGFSIRSGHSSGYSGWIGGRLYAQIPSERHHAISDEPFELHNNHGRFFGPHFWNGKYFFIGAMSREKVGIEPKLEHLYVSFNQARDRFAQALEEKGGFKITDFIAVQNAILGDPQLGTGDHDGVAVVLTAAK